MSEQNAKRDWSKVQRRHKGQLNIRLTEAERLEIEERAGRASASLAGYVKAAALNAPLPRRSSRAVSADQAAILKLLAELGKLGSNANQIARANNVLARSVASSSMADASEAKAAIDAGKRNLEQINGTLEAFRSAIFDALNMKA